MSGPLIYISTWKIKEDRLEDFKHFTRELVAIYEANEPQLIAFNVYLNEDETEMTSIHVHPNADSMDFHLGIVERALGEEMYKWVERGELIEPRPERIDIYGVPSTALLEADQPAVDAGVTRGVKSRSISPGSLVLLPADRMQLSELKDMGV